LPVEPEEGVDSPSSTSRWKASSSPDEVEVFTVPELVVRRTAVRHRACAGHRHLLGHVGVGLELLGGEDGYHGASYPGPLMAAVTNVATTIAVGMAEIVPSGLVPVNLLGLSSRQVHP
jgi:hypothetical protein